MAEKRSSTEPSMSRQVAARDSIRALIWIGVLALVYSAVNTIMPPATQLVILVGDVVLGLALIASGVWLARHRPSPARVAWLFAGAIAAVGIWGVWAYVEDPTTVHLLYVTILLTSFGPMTAAWRPFTTAGLVVLAAASAVLVYVGGKGTVSWIIGMSAGLAISAVLLRIRMRSIHELDIAEQAILEASTRDQLTGVLNRHGLRDRMPALWSDATRRGETVAALFLDVRGLKQVNDTCGHDVGDIVLQDAARSIVETARGGDLVARWGGDEFVVVGVGSMGASDAFAGRLNTVFSAMSEARRDHRVGEISVGQAVASPVDVDFDTMLREADADMYARRELDVRTAS